MRWSSAAKSMVPGNVKFSMKVALPDVIGGHQAYIQREICGASNFASG